MMQEQQHYLRPAAIIDSDHPRVRNFARRTIEGATSPRERAMRIFYAVRDGWRYNPYEIRLTAEDMRASRLLERNEGHCIDKAVLMIAALRASDIPARLCLSKVKNHIALDQMLALLGSDELVPHGYLEAWLEERWVKTTPAFNRKLCDKLNVTPLEWDGREDAIFQAYDRQGGQFMEYLEEYGHFADVPLERIIELMRAHYPAFANADLVVTREKLKSLGGM